MPWPFKSREQPLCRRCAARIRKVTVTVHCGQSNPGKVSTFSRSIPDKPKNRAECERLTNDRVVSLSYWPSKSSAAAGRALGNEEPERYVGSFSTWDGESYDSEFFCSNACAQKFGHAAARQGFAMPAYNEAIRKSRDAAQPARAAP